MHLTDCIEYLKGKYGGLLLNKKEVAKELRRSPATIDRLRKTGHIKAKKIGNEVFFTVDEVARFIAA